MSLAIALAVAHVPGMTVVHDFKRAARPEKELESWLGS
jgi:hypothetical protein